MTICEHFGLDAHPDPEGSGVYTGRHKVASIGVHIRHWINLHGIALNVDMDLTFFDPIQPCGLDPSLMSDLSKELSRKVSMDEAKQAARSALPALLRGE